MSSVSPLDIAHYHRHPLEKKSATIKNAMDILRAHFVWSVQNGLTQLEPVGGTKKVAERVAKFLKYGE